MVWSRSVGFERLLTTSNDLVPINAVEVFAKNGHSPIIVTDQDLESCNLVEVEGPVVTDKE